MSKDYKKALPLGRVYFIRKDYKRKSPPFREGWGGPRVGKGLTS